jgi:hypothetical protein
MQSKHTPVVEINAECFSLVPMLLPTIFWLCRAAFISIIKCPGQKRHFVLAFHETRSVMTVNKFQH